MPQVCPSSKMGLQYLKKYSHGSTINAHTTRMFPETPTIKMGFIYILLGCGAVECTMGTNTDGICLYSAEMAQ
jgi:hypothetical protein